MLPYLFRRLLLIPPTLLGILLLNFAIIQAAPGGPIEQVMAQMGGMDSMSSTRMDSSRPVKFPGGMTPAIVALKESMPNSLPSWNSSLVLIGRCMNASF